MKRFTKVILLSITAVLLLTGCTGFFGRTKKDGASTDNLDDEVIISQVKEQLKKNMNKIGFAVDVDEFDYRVKAFPQTGSTSGSVAITYKFFPEYDGFLVYEGSLGSKKRNKTIDNENVSKNPILFVAGGYQAYVVENIFNNKEIGNNLEMATLKTKGKILPYLSDYKHKFKNQTGKLFNPEEEIKQRRVNNTTFLNSTVEIEEEKYFDLFKNKHTKNFNYSMLQKEMKYVAHVGLYVDTTDDKINELQEQVKEYFNKETMIITVTNYKEK